MLAALSGFFPNFGLECRIQRCIYDMVGVIAEGFHRYPQHHFQHLRSGVAGRDKIIQSSTVDHASLFNHGTGKCRQGFQFLIGQRLTLAQRIDDRGCDSLFVLVIRYCIEEGLVRGGVFAAMQDKRLAIALGLIHQQPWHPWTLAELCTRSGLSKTVLSEKFTAFIGYSPIEYLTAWRLQIAAPWLMEPNMSVERVAERCSYESVPAFSKAFKRHFGMTPGAFRRA